MKTLVALLLMLPGAVAAETPITADEFERIVTGKTFAYGSNGIAYGAEAYFSNRRVQWTFLDGECSDGTWYAAGDRICFVYDDIPGPQCWLFYEHGGRLSAEFVGQSGGSQLYETERQSEPLQCLGPKVGV